MTDYSIVKDSATRPLAFFLVLAADGRTGATGKSPTVTISKNCAAFDPPAGAVSEIGGGWYKVAGDADDSDTAGPLLLHAEAADCDAADHQFEVIEYDIVAEMHLIKACLANLRTKTIATGVAKVYDDDGITLLQTLTPTEEDGVITVTPS